ncbi:hypothetical protein C6W19_18180 [Bacillus sp. RJGP41]|uniref:DUF6236 family protein n=1 Tax=Peribacillus frigoritolerans TaxID=450367 RepID=UPI000D037DBC|nr:hypothetical protein C6W19_18180 [Bacillus sp. RJGP41]
MFKYLYYPSMALPNDMWLRSTLLYSDKIASIVPSDIQRSLKDQIKFLEDENEFEMLTPESFFENFKKSSDFETEVIEYFNSKMYQEITKKPSTNAITEFHNSKFSYQIMNTLRKHSFLKDIDDMWSELPHYIGTIYMGILAKYMAQEKNYIPTTNLISNQDLVYKSISEENEIQAGELLLIEALPTPTIENSLESIITFKKQRKNELYRFRTILRNYTTKISQSETEQDIFNHIQEFKEEVELGLYDISRLLTERKISFRLNSLNTLIHLKNPALLGTLANVYSKQNDFSPLIGTAIGGCIGLGIQYIQSRVKTNYEINNSPYSYVFHSNNALRRNDSRIFSNLVTKH